MAESPKQPSESVPCTYDSSGGVFAHGYCVWDGSVVVSCHCEDGYVCGGAPSTGESLRFAGELRKSACTKSP